MRILQSQIKLSVITEYFEYECTAVYSRESYKAAGPRHCFTRTRLRRMCSALFLTYPAPHRQAQTLHSIAPLPSRFSNLRRYSVPAARQEPARSTQQTSAGDLLHSLVKCH